MTTEDPDDRSLWSQAAGGSAHAFGGVSELRAWRVLRKLRCCPRRAGRLAKAIHVLQNYEVAAG